MKSLQLLFVFWCSNLFAGASYTEAVIDGYSCVTDYWYTITCVLNITGDPLGRNKTNYWLDFKWNIGLTFTCPLVMMDHSYRCTVVAYKSSRRSRGSFSTVHTLILLLCYETGCHTVTDDFQPAQNIQLTPPHDVVVQRTTEKFIITWKSGYENHPYLKNQLHYELLLQTYGIGNKDRRLVSESNSTSFERSQLELQTKHCVKVKSHPFLTDYNGIWSKWSPPTCWRTEPHAEPTKDYPEQENVLLILTKSVGPVCVVVGVLLFLFYNPATRMKIKTLFHTPSPAPFFLPLFQEHKGNLQEWLSPQGSVILKYKTEEILTTDALIIVPKLITKEQEEEQELQDSSVTPLTFTQCQTSYVGLPGMDGASLPFLNGNCQADTSYTQLPCSALDFGFGEAGVVTSSPEDSLDTSRADSGCEDLTLSPECSFPSSPLHTSQAQCLCDDYCILNKTAEGIVPILLPKGRSLDVPSASLQTDESCCGI